VGEVRREWARPAVTGKPCARELWGQVVAEWKEKTQEEGGESGERQGPPIHSQDRRAVAEGQGALPKWATLRSSNYIQNFSTGCVCVSHASDLLGAWVMITSALQPYRDRTLERGTPFSGPEGVLSGVSWH
jgi:hypothetical protein